VENDGLIRGGQGRVAGELVEMTKRLGWVVVWSLVVLVCGLIAGLWKPLVGG